MYSLRLGSSSECTLRIPFSQPIAMICARLSSDHISPARTQLKKLDREVCHHASHMNLLARPMRPPEPPPWPFMYIERAIFAALLIADCLSAPGATCPWLLC